MMKDIIPITRKTRNSRIGRSDGGMRSKEGSDEVLKGVRTAP